MPTASTSSTPAGWRRRAPSRTSSSAAAPSPASPRGNSPDSKARRSTTMRKVLFLFGQLNDDDVEWMLTAGAKRFVPAGVVLIQQGVPVAPVFILLEGRLAVRLPPPRESEKEIARLNAGEIVGEMS